jgi:hypothetical protein
MLGDLKDACVGSFAPHSKAAFVHSQRRNPIAVTHCAEATCTHAGKTCAQVALNFQSKMARTAALAAVVLLRHRPPGGTPPSHNGKHRVADPYGSAYRINGSRLSYDQNSATTCGCDAPQGMVPSSRFNNCPSSAHVLRHACSRSPPGISAVSSKPLSDCVHRQADDTPHKVCTCVESPKVRAGGKSRTMSRYPPASFPPLGRFAQSNLITGKMTQANQKSKKTIAFANSQGRRKNAHESYRPWIRILRP